MDFEDIHPGAPAAGSPEVRDIVSDPLGIAEPSRSVRDIPFAQAAEELEFGRLTGGSAI